jgi:hypothetical protein
MQTFRGTRADLAALMRQIPQALAGGPDPFEIARSIQLRAGVTLLGCVASAFITKSRGGIGEDGIQWLPLQRATIAQRRTTAQERRSLSISGQRQRGLLTPAQNKKWKQIFGTRLARFRLMGMGEAEAKAGAARIAWAILKSEGAQTKLQVLGSRKVDIGRDTSRMFRSLSPGVEDRPSGQTEQVFQVAPGSVIVGSNVPYFVPFHRRRPVWPLDGSLPDPWADAILRSMSTGVVRAVALLVERGRI